MCRACRRLRRRARRCGRSSAADARRFCVEARATPRQPSLQTTSRQRARDRHLLSPGRAREGLLPQLAGVTAPRGAILRPACVACTGTCAASALRALAVLVPPGNASGARAVVSHVERPRDAGASEQRGRARTVLLMSRWRPSRVQSAVRDGRCGAAGPGCLRDGHRLGPSRARVGDVRGGQAENLLHDLQKLVKSCRAGPTRWKKGSSPQRERAAGHRQRPPGCLLLRVEHLVVDVVRQVPTLQRKSHPLRSNGHWWQPPWRGLRRPLLQRSAARDVLEGGCGVSRRPRQVVAAPRKLPKLARQSWSGRPV